MSYVIDLSENQEYNEVPTLIVQMQAPATYTTQAGGTHCVHPHVQGVLVPLLAGAFDPAGKLHELWFSASGYSNPAAFAFEYMERIPLIRRLLEEAELDGILEPIDSKEGIMMWLVEWGEAWVPVCIKEDPSPEVVNYTAIKALKGRYAILTYQNSD